MDRGILSNLVYGEIQDNFQGYEYIMTKLIDDMVDIGAKVVYLKHKNRESAMIKYELSTSRNTSSDDEYDKFESFEDYWSKYLDMDERFMRWVEALKVKGLDIEIIELDVVDMTWEASQVFYYDLVVEKTS